MPREMRDALLPAFYQRLAASPWVRPEAVARGRARLLDPQPPSAEEVARSLIEWVIGAQSH